MNPYPYKQYAPPQQQPPQGYGYAPQPGGTSEDVQNLNALSICHFIYAGLVGLVSLIFGGVLMFTMFATAGAAASAKGGGPEAAAVMGIIDIVFAVVVVFFLAKAALLAYSGACIRKRRHRTLSFVMACISCLNIPLGTALGVFTLVVLSRPSVKAMYDHVERFGAPAPVPQ